MTTLTAEQVLDCPMGGNDADATTIRDYLGKLLYTVWREEQGFSGKRPFGDSCWQNEVYEALAGAALIDGTKDAWNDWEYDEEEADGLILMAIRHLGGNDTEDDE